MHFPNKTKEKREDVPPEQMRPHCYDVAVCAPSANTAFVIKERLPCFSFCLFFSY
jgi:hypothetical protein